MIIDRNEILSEMTTTKLVGLYNAMAKDLNLPTLKKFRDKTTAVKRCLKLRNEWCEAFPEASVEKKVIKKVKKVKKVKKIAKAKKANNQTIKSLTIDLIMNGTDDADIVDMVKKQFPDSKYDTKHVSWYRSTLFRDGVISVEHAPRHSAVYKAYLAKTDK